MCKWRIHILIFLITAGSVSLSYGHRRDSTARPHIPDSISTIRHLPNGDYYDEQLHDEDVVVPFNYRDRERERLQDEKSDAFYDSLRQRYKNPITRFLMRALVRSRDASDEGAPMTDFKKNRRYFELFQGKRITHIRILQANVFSPRDSSQHLSWGQNFIDKIHIRTKEKQLRQNLLFREGDAINPYLMGVNEELLRKQPYFSTAYFVVLPDKVDTTGVIVQVFARDNWSISGDVGWGDRKRIAIFDRNFLGTGDEIRLSYTCDKLFKNSGGEIEYTVRNMLGTFARIHTRLGVGRGQNVAMINAERPVILPNDHAWGFTAGHVYAREDLKLRDTSYYVDRFNMGLWYLKSWALSWRRGTSIYLAGSISKQSFNERPEVGDRLNPYYHGYRNMMFSFGMAQRNYFQGNMIYGYGRTEDIPYGFKTELLFGREWGEYLGARTYVGFRGIWGNLIKDHYLELGFNAGTYLHDDHLQQSVLTTHLKYFTPLLRIRSSYLRQFGVISVGKGFHRLEGEREALRYEKEHGIRGLKDNEWLYGYNRFVASSETVLFTPIFLYHFRFAFYLYGDVGWIGNDPNLFQNKFTGSVGLGVRIKNERLIFRNIQLRFGIAFNRPDGIGYSHFEISSEQDYEDFNLTPGRPEMIKYE